HFTHRDAILEPERAHGPSSLREITLVNVDGEYLSAALRQLNRVEAAVAAHVQYRPSGEVLGNDGRDRVPLVVWKVAKPVVRRRLRAVRKTDVVKPCAKMVGYPCLMLRHARAPEARSPRPPVPRSGAVR